MRNLFRWLPVASGFLVLVLSMVVAVFTVSQRSSKNNLATTQNLNTKAAEQIASLSFSPATGGYNYSSGATYPVGIILDSAGKSVDGVDVIVKFDPKKVQVVSSKVATTSLFQEFPQNMIDNVLGQIKFSALTFNSRPVTGIVGTFTFRPLAKGTVDLTFDYTFGATRDSNIAEHGSAKDLLGQVTNGSYSFK